MLFPEALALENRGKVLAELAGATPGWFEKISTVSVTDLRTNAVNDKLPKSFAFLGGEEVRSTDRIYTVTGHARDDDEGVRSSYSVEYIDGAMIVTISTPLSVIQNISLQIVERMLIDMFIMGNQKARCVLAAGPEYEMSATSVSTALDEALDRQTLAIWIVADNSDLARKEIAGFEIQHSFSGNVLLRHVHWTARVYNVLESPH